LRLTTARYFTPSGHSIQAKGIIPDIEVKQEVPSDLVGKDETPGEAGLRGHLKNGEQEKSGSSAYVPLDQSKDLQLRAALNILNGRPMDAKPAPLVQDRAVQTHVKPTAAPLPPEAKEIKIEKKGDKLKPKPSKTKEHKRTQ